MSSGLFDRFSAGMRKNGWFPVLLAVLAIFLLIQVIRLVWTIVTPLGPVGEWKASEVRVLPLQSRLALFNSFDPFFRGEQASTGTVVTSLQLTLYGIRMNTGSGLGSAILAGPDGVQESYAIGDEIAPGATLASVQFDHVTIDRGGVKESLYLDQSVPAETVDPQLHNVTETPAEERLEPLAKPNVSAEGDTATESSSDQEGQASQ